MRDPDEIGPMVAVREFVDAFNNQDVDRMQAACADATTIIDDFAPHEWAGSEATTRWYREMAAMAAGYGISGWSVTLTESHQVAVSDRRAYVVAPIDLQYLRDAAARQRAGFMTLSLGEDGEQWRISALAWTWEP